MCAVPTETLTEDGGLSLDDTQNDDDVMSKSEIIYSNVSLYVYILLWRGGVMFGEGSDSQTNLTFSGILYGRFTCTHLKFR